MPRPVGLLLLQAGPDVLRFVPPLSITDEELAEGLSRLHEALSDFAAGSNDGENRSGL
ncbi:Acetylornithine aminotransferase OS=Rhodanobacter lindaniclasticus OX=75310 GN=argD PE=3 SV=1 [Rhodanobacter lindaniclasticus]